MDEDFLKAFGFVSIGMLLIALTAFAIAGIVDTLVFENIDPNNWDCTKIHTPRQGKQRCLQWTSREIEVDLDLVDE